MPTSLDDATREAAAIADAFTGMSGAIINASLRILLIVVLAVLVRAVLGRLITKIVERVVAARERLDATSASRLARNGKNGGNGNGGAAAVRRQARARTLGSVLRNVASILIYGVAAVTILGELGVNIGPVLASAGVVGLAIGFGAQGLVQDFLAGMFILVEDQYGVGDVVDVGDAFGTVEEVGLRVTKIRDLDGGLWFVRNGQILRVGNMSQEWANAVVEIPLATSVDPERAAAVMAAAAADFADNGEGAGDVLERPEANGVVRITTTAMTFRVTAKTKPGTQWAVGRALRAHLKRALDAQGVALAHTVASTAEQ